MEAIILAAGRGSRLGATTEDLPKSMVELGGRTLFDRTVTQLRAHGIDRVTVVTGYRADRLPTQDLNVVHNDWWQTTGIAYSLLQAVPHLTGPVIVAYSDIVFEPRVLQALISHDHDGIAIAVNTDWQRLWQHRMDNVLADAESLRRTPDWRITEIGQPAATVDDIQGQFMGLIRIDRSAQEQFFNLYRDALRAEPLDVAPSPGLWDMTTWLNRWLTAGGHIAGVPVHGGWLEVDTTSDLDTYTRLHATGELTSLCRLG
ncbi:choline kinase [Kribbella aluminosa]|uniref:Choline kinase n=1 Tax=Kribbella aluminosa TaxID=416017 RepID=A0ABS4UNS5_9ACTN|nr:phosphocholine cytidylyltransferase family protein [Kribbella aluminosa]MBP2353293.1 choline kinase [Kribbella aluminosa]